MSNLFRVIINGETKTDSVSGCTVSYSINRLYNVASFTFNEKIKGEEPVAIHFGNNVFNGFVFSCKKVSENAYTIEARSNTAKMTEPFESKDTYMVEDATTSHALCDLYASKYGIPIQNTSGNLNYGGNFEKTTTALGVITTMANVTGAEFWYDGSVIHIEPNKPITSAGTVIDKSEVFGFMPYANTIENKGVKRVTVGVEPYPDTVTTDIKCNATMDACSGEVMARIIPHDTFDRSVGIELSPVKTRMALTQVMASSISLTLEADIVEILSIRLNNAEIQDYTFAHDTVLFDSVKRGMIYVEYIGHGHRGYANIKDVGGSRYTEFDIYYGNCDKYEFQEQVECNNSSGSVVECLGTTLMTPKNMNYPVGFNMQSVGEVPTFQFFTDTTILTVNVVSTAQSFQWVEKATLSIEANGDIFHLLRFSADSITQVSSNGVDITANTTLLDNKVFFDKEYRGVLISYLVSGLNHFIKFDDQAEDVTMIINGECSVGIQGTDYNSTSSYECVEGTSIAINMIEELGVKPHEATHRSVTVVDPVGAINTLSTDAFGVLKLNNIVFGTYKINTSSIKSGSRMTLIAGG